MKRKLILVVTILAATAVFLLCGCKELPYNDPNTLDIVCTTFPQYDWVKNITRGAEGVKITLLCDKGSDIHGYLPGFDDILAARASDVFIYVGGEGEQTIAESVSGEKSVEAVNLMHLLSEHTGEDAHHPKHIHTEECESGHSHDEAEIDEHVWMSLKNAVLFCEEITEILCEKDEKNSEIYRKNCLEYTTRLKELDREFAEVVNSAEKKVCVVADRFPFAHLVNDYGIECFAAFPGCSSETNATFETVIKLADKVKEYRLKSVVVTENTTGATASAVAETSGVKNIKTVVLDSMQSVSLEDTKNGVTYISVMESNLDALAEILEVR